MLGALQFLHTSLGYSYYLIATDVGWLGAYVAMYGQTRRSAHTLLVVFDIDVYLFLLQCGQFVMPSVYVVAFTCSLMLIGTYTME